MAQPCLSYPSLFARGTIFDKYPYLLPNLVCTFVVGLGVIIGILFLEETHAEKKKNPDAGIEAGKWILSKFQRCAKPHAIRSEKVIDMSEAQSLIDDDLPGYRSVDASPNLLPRISLDIQEALNIDAVIEPPPQSGPTPTRAFTKQVVLNIIGYGILA